eukprot:1732443-Prymnesium_polylepis.1
MHIAHALSTCTCVLFIYSSSARAVIRHIPPCCAGPYIATQTSPGVVLINVPAMLSIVSIIVASSSIQARAEGKLIAAQPERFPPPMGKYVKEVRPAWIVCIPAYRGAWPPALAVRVTAFGEWLRGKSGKPLLVTVRAALEECNAEAAAKGQGNAGILTDINIAAAGIDASWPSQQAQPQMCGRAPKRTKPGRGKT